MSTWTTFGGPIAICGFTECDDAGGPERLVAVVVRRMVPQRPKRLSMWEFLRTLRKRRSPTMPPFVPLTDGWSGAVDHGGSREVLYSRERRVVRLRGRDFAIPTDGGALAVLLDETAPDVDGSLRVHALAPCTVPRKNIDLTGDKAEIARRVVEMHRGRQSVWLEQVHRDPVVAAFITVPAE